MKRGEGGGTEFGVDEEHKGECGREVCRVWGGDGEEEG